MRNRYQGPFKNHPASYDVSVSMGLYRGIARYVVDGDTMDVLVDLGLNHSFYLTVRLYAFDAPEMSTPEGILYKQAAEILLPPDTCVLVRTIKDKTTFGRYLADMLYYSPRTNAFVDLVSQLTRYDPTIPPNKFPFV